MFDKDITVINKWFNKSTKKEEYKVSHIKGFWSSDESISISNVSLIKSDSINCLILMSEDGYQEPKEFQENPTGWTLKNDDYLAKGNVEEFTSIAELKENYQAFKITNVATLDYGSEDMQHFEVKCE